MVVGIVHLLAKSQTFCCFWQDLCFYCPAVVNLNGLVEKLIEIMAEFIPYLTVWQRLCIIFPANEGGGLGLGDFGWGWGGVESGFHGAQGSLKLTV